MKNITAILMAILILIVACTAYASHDEKEIEKAVAGYMAGKITVTYVDWVFGENILTVDKIARKQGTNLADLAEKIRLDLASLVKKARATKSGQEDAVNVQIATFRYMFFAPSDLVRPTPQECDLTKTEFLEFLMNIEEQYRAMLVEKQEATFFSTCIENSLKVNDKGWFGRLLADEEIQKFIESRAHTGEWAVKINWLWEQYRIYDKPKK